ncbi:MAG: DUF2194 domain-containing protein [Eubacteriales bacterium]|nr:DUF2194 domain-containing protein [Eubacteriales bacterium]
MISRRNFFVIFLMMCVLLFMFQFSQIVKQNSNQYDTNEYHVSNLPSKEYSWKLKSEEEMLSDLDSRYVIFLGTDESTVRDTVMQWCTYTKRNVLERDDLSEIDSLQEHLPELLLVDSKSVDIDEQIFNVKELAEKGVPVIFCNLPDVNQVKQNQVLQALLGIEEIREDKTIVDGLYLFSGFLLGGEAIYKANTVEEQKLQDFDLVMPWYICGSGSKTYMVGLKNEQFVKRDEFPRVLWRNHYDNTMIFAMNGDFCDSLTGMGILDAFVFECNDYMLYPVVNAQGTLIADYPTLAKENSNIMKAIYSRENDAVMRDIMWPSILSMASKNDIKMTCYIQTKYNYTNDVKPSDDQLVFFLQQMKEANAEAGRSMNYYGGVTMSEKAKQDDSFYQNANYAYQFGTAYVNNISDDLKWALNEKNALEGIHTISCYRREKEPILSYYTDDVTLLGVTEVAREYSFTKDLRYRSTVTALGYSNLLIDLHRVMWPTSNKDHWQIYFDDVISNVDTFYSKYMFFDQTTMSSADERARAFLNLSYREEREGNEIRLQVENAGENAYFMFRTHGEQIKQITGGSFTALGDDMYLLHVTDTDVKIETETSESVWQYKEPFK